MRGKHPNRESSAAGRGVTDRTAAGSEEERIGADWIIAGLAADQHGVVARQQLLGAGVSGDAIDRRVRGRRLHRVRRGIYLVGFPRPSTRALQMAAVLACSPSAALSHRSAAELWALLGARRGRAPESVTVVGRDPGTKPGIRVHRVKRLHPDEIRTCHGIPVTSPARTLLDLATEVDARELERAVAEAQVCRLVTRRRLRDLLERHHGRAGAGRLRRVAALNGGPALTRSGAEELFLKLMRRSGLPAPEVNVRLGPYEVDFAWRRERLVVEIDGFRYHSSHLAFERDRERDARLAAQGWLVVRVTWQRLRHRPEAVVADLAAALAARASDRAGA